MLDNLRIGQKILFSNLSMAAVVAIAGVVGIVGVGLVGDAGIYASEELSPMADAVNLLRLHATTSHLKFEEVLSGDRKETEVAWRELERADWYARAILNGGRDGSRVFTATTNPEVRTNIEAVRQSVRSFSDLARDRLASAEDAGAGTDADAKFDATFEDFMDKAEAAASAIEVEIAGGTEALRETRGRARNALLVAIVVAVVLAFFVGSRLAESLAKPIVELSLQSERIARGDLSVELGKSSRGDEVGALERSFGTMVVGMRGMLGNVQSSVATLTSSSLGMVEIAQTSAASAAEQASTVSEVTATVAQIRKTSETAATTAQRVLQTSEQAVEQGGRGVGSANEAADLMRVIQERVEGVGKRVLELSEQTTQIGEIIDTVNDLAEQSNLLAVNASIEAARAGEQGRAFSVVAGEVRSLAEQSKRAAQRVRTILGDVRRATDTAVMATEESSKRVGDGLRKVDNVREVIDELRTVLLDSADRARQIEASSREQVTGIGQIATVMDALNGSGRATAASARQLRDSASSLTALSGQLKESSARYTV